MHRSVARTQKTVATKNAGKKNVATTVRTYKFASTEKRALEHLRVSYRRARRRRIETGPPPDGGTMHVWNEQIAYMLYK